MLHTPVEIIGDKNHRVTAMKCQLQELGEPDASGRRKPQPIPDAFETLEFDTVVISIGNKPNPLIAATTDDLATSKWGTVQADPDTMATNLPGVFAGGDIVSGAATVILAMGQGKIAARSIDNYLNGRPLKPEAAAGNPA
jgi:glutamate synthase (NADPH) small chain